MRCAQPSLYNRVVEISVRNLSVVEGLRGSQPARFEIPQSLLDPTQVIGVRAAAVCDPVPDLPQFPDSSLPYRLVDQGVAEQVPVPL